MYSKTDSNRDIVIEILPVRNNSYSTTVTTKTSSISNVSESETVQNSYHEYEKYFSVNEGVAHTKIVNTDNCFEFSDPVTLAKNMVETIKEESEGIFGPSYLTEENKNFTCSDTEFTTDVNKEKTDFTWPTIKDFTVEEGALKIDEYLSSFYTEENWMYVMYYRGAQVNSSLSAHKYQVMFSLPTWKYPVAQATASLYFVVEVSKLKPPTCPVNVLYWYETFRQIHSPNTLKFDEKWLKYILDEKIKLFRQITY